MYQAYQQRKLESSELETQLARAQLQTLRMQLQPHFLFNTLNGIMVLIKKNPQTARTMLSQLSDLLRLTLDHHERQEVLLREELAILNKYLEIERTRFRDRLSVDFQVENQVLNALVPPFILQPLVENSIKHCVSKVPGPASILISARKANDSLILTVKDNGLGMSSGKSSMSDGIGLKNTKARLIQMYGFAATLELLNGSRSGLEAVVTIPLSVRRNGKGRNRWNG
jgi:LytS/YehU family sensor histidine kinase